MEQTKNRLHRHTPKRYLFYVEPLVVMRRPTAEQYRMTLEALPKRQDESPEG